MCIFIILIREKKEASQINEKYLVSRRERKQDSSKEEKIVYIGGSLRSEEINENLWK